MSYTSDLVHDSRLDTRFHPKYVIHKHYDASLRPGERPVLREEIWKRVRLIGGGAYGQVWLENCSKGGRSHTSRAVKEIRSVRNARERVNFSRELEAIAKFSHQKYVRCFVESFGWYESADALFISMEYFPQGDLQRYLSVSPPLAELEAQQISFQLIEGLAFMHENGFAHRDLKPSNILVKSQPPEPWWVKIGDFGISKRAEDGAAFSSTLKGTLAYMAPELHEFVGALHCFASDAQAASRASDMWSLGEIMFQMLTKEPTFRNMAMLHAFVQQSDLFPDGVLKNRHVSDPGIALIRGLMKPEPNQRMRIEEALLHVWTNSWRSSSSKPPSIISIGSSDGPDEILFPDPVVASDPSGRWSTVSYNETPLVASESDYISKNTTLAGITSQIVQHGDPGRLGSSTQTINGLAAESDLHRPRNVTMNNLELELLDDEVHQHMSRSNHDTSTIGNSSMDIEALKTFLNQLTHNGSEKTVQPTTLPTRPYLKDRLTHDIAASAQGFFMPDPIEPVRRVPDSSKIYLNDSTPQSSTSLSRTITPGVRKLPRHVEDTRFRNDIAEEQDIEYIKVHNHVLNGQNNANADSTLDFDRVGGRLEPSAASMCLILAHRARDPTRIAYPHGINPPDARLNANAPANRRFRYDRDFLLQFRDVFKENPLGWDSRLQTLFDGSEDSPRTSTAVQLPTVTQGPPNNPSNSLSDRPFAVNTSPSMVGALKDQLKHYQDNRNISRDSENEKAALGRKFYGESSAASDSAILQVSGASSDVFTEQTTSAKEIPLRKSSFEDILPKSFNRIINGETIKLIVSKDGSGQVENERGEAVGVVYRGDSTKLQGLPVTFQGRVLSWQGQLVGRAHLYKTIPQRMATEEAEPYLGNSVFDIPHTDDFLERIYSGRDADDDEYKHTRCTMVTGTPSSFNNRTYVLRPSQFPAPRHIQLVLAVNMDILPRVSKFAAFLDDLFSAMSYARFLSDHTSPRELQARSFWKAMALVMVVRELDGPMINLFASLGLLTRWRDVGNNGTTVHHGGQKPNNDEHPDDGSRFPPRDFKGEAVTARIYEYTTQLRIRLSTSRTGQYKVVFDMMFGRPVQLILCRSESASIADTEPWLNAITNNLQPRLCIKYQLDKQIPRVYESSIYNTWKANATANGPMKTVFHKSSLFDKVKLRGQNLI